MNLQTLYNQRTIFHDERTGREVWKMTSWDDCHCLASYMYYQSFSGDEQYLVFTSNRSGRYEIYRLEIESGETVQLTDYAGSDVPEVFMVALNFHPNGRELFYDDGRSLWAVEIASLERREVMRRPPQWRPDENGPHFSLDGRQVFFSFRDEDERVGFAAVEASGGTPQDFYRWPESGASDSQTLATHLQIAPTPTHTLTFAPWPDYQNDPNETREHRARTWKLTVGSNRAEPFLVMPPGFRATHEHWGRTAAGEPRLFFHKKTVPTWTPASLASIALDGGDFQEHYISDRKLGHSCLSPDGSTLVSDVQDPSGNELIVVDMASGADEVLCWPDSSVQSDVLQIGHVHPSFSPSGDKLLYTSDKSGYAAVFLLPLLA
jgi:oligogalacturonide lyase